MLVTDTSLIRSCLTFLVILVNLDTGWSNGDKAAGGSVSGAETFTREQHRVVLRMTDIISNATEL